MKRVYFDHNATTPIEPSILNRLNHWAEAWGNPSSIHEEGRKPKLMLREARAQLAKVFGAKPLELVFTSGGSEANSFIIEGVFHRLQKVGKNHYLVGATEHPSVIKSFEFIKSLGAEIETVPVGCNGEVDLEKFENQIRPNTGLISMMVANNETGVVYPIKKMAKIAHKKGVLFHSDCVQAVGKMKFKINDLGVDFATLSAHKFYSLKGCGVAFVKTGVGLESLIHGGGQERGRRAGTENLLAISAFSEVSKNLDEIDDALKRMSSLRDTLENWIQENISDVRINGRNSKRVVNTSNMVIEGVDGETLLMNLDMKGFAVSTGAACSSGSQEPSPALLAMGLTREEAQSSLRVSLGWGNTQEEVNAFCEVLKSVVTRIRNINLKEMRSSGVAGGE